MNVFLDLINTGEEDYFSTIKLPAAYQSHNLKVLSSNLRGGNAKLWASQVVLGVKNMPASAGIDSIPGSGRSPGEGNGNPFQYFRPYGQRSWQTTVHGVKKSWT